MPLPASRKLINAVSDRPSEKRNAVSDDLHAAADADQQIIDGMVDDRHPENSRDADAAQQDVYKRQNLYFIV